MRHYLGYQADGMFVSYEIAFNGWNLCECGTCTPEMNAAANPTCRAEHVQRLLQTRKVQNPEIVGYYAYDCPCPPKGTCGCPTKLGSGFYFNLETGQPTPRTLVKLLVDGEEIEPGKVVSRAPGVKMQFQLEAAVPDGWEATCAQRGPVDIIDEDEFKLAFSGGRSAIVEFTAPSQGLKVQVGVGGKYLKGATLIVRGWA